MSVTRSPEGGRSCYGVTDFTTVELLQRDRDIGRELTHINDMMGQVLQHYQDVIDMLPVTWNYYHVVLPVISQLFKEYCH